MPVDALNRLLRLNLLVAHRLRLLETISLSEVEGFSELPGVWGNPAFTPINQYERAVSSAHYGLQRFWRLRSCRLDEDVTLSRVVRLADLAFALEATGPVSRDGFEALQSRFRRLDLAGVYAEASSASAISAAALLMADLRATIVNRRSAPYRVPVEAIHASGSCWVAEGVNAHPNLTAQICRDRFGLHHYPSTGDVGDQLVLVQFEARISASACPTEIDPGLQDRVPDGIWLIRPTIADKPNTRFVQGHEADSLHAAAATGRTIHIGTKAYVEADTELILLAGRDAELRWHDALLLPGGPPRRHPHDDDHTAFADMMHSRLDRFA